MHSATDRVVWLVIVEARVRWRGRGPELLTGHHIGVVMPQFVKLVLCEPLLPIIHSGSPVTRPGIMKFVDQWVIL